MWQKLLTKFAFLGSTRFWELVVAGVVYGLWQGGIIDTSTFGAIETILLGSVTVRTTDRFAEKIGKKE